MTFGEGPPPPPYFPSVRDSLALFPVLWEEKEPQAMNIIVEIPDDRAARFQKEAQARGLSVDRWLLELAERNAPALPAKESPKRTLAEVCAKVRGLADDLDFSRDPSPGRDVVL